MAIADRTITPQELSECTGKDGAPSYVACRGVVYDVSGSFLWRNGKHQATHFAGCDHTLSLEQAPHGEDMLRRCPIVGRLVEVPVEVP